MIDVRRLRPAPEERGALHRHPPSVSLTERNPASAPGARLSSRLPLNTPDRVPQRVLDKILWQSVHGRGSEPPPPGPNASGLDEGR